jgi:hypothetical protein
MKKITLLVAIAFAGFACFEGELTAADQEGGPPGLQKKNGVPPGLQKKGGLPPGQAKKRGKQAQEEELAPAVKQAPTAPGVTPVPPKAGETAPAPTPPATAKAPDATKSPTTPEVAKPAPKVSKEVQERRERLATYVGELDKMAEKPEVRDRLMRRLTSRMDVPFSTVQADQKAHPNLGLGGLLIGHHIAKLSRTPSAQILAEHKAGKSWGEIANDHKVSLVELNERAREAKEAARDAARK